MCGRLGTREHARPACSPRPPFPPQHHHAPLPTELRDRSIGLRAGDHTESRHAHRDSTGQRVRSSSSAVVGVVPMSIFWAHTKGGRRGATARVWVGLRAAPTPARRAPAPASAAAAGVARATSQPPQGVDHGTTLLAPELAGPIVAHLALPLPLPRRIQIESNAAVHQSVGCVGAVNDARSLFGCLPLPRRLQTRERGSDCCCAAASPLGRSQRETRARRQGRRRGAAAAAEATAARPQRHQRRDTHIKGGMRRRRGGGAEEETAASPRARREPLLLPPGHPDRS